MERPNEIVLAPSETAGVTGFGIKEQAAIPTAKMFNPLLNAPNTLLEYGSPESSCKESFIVVNNDTPTLNNATMRLRLFCDSETEICFYYEKMYSRRMRVLSLTHQ